jgi:Uma2 family endonuclease
MAYSARTNGLLTSAQFLEQPAAAEHSELVRGVIRMMTPAGGAHGLVSGNAFRLLSTYVREHSLGRCFADSTGFELPSVLNTVRAPDASFVRASRLPVEGIGAEGGWLQLAPDVAVEVLSPSETASDIADKLADYRAAGTAAVWLIDPAKRTVGVLTLTRPVQWLTDGDTLDGDDLIPGFACAVSDLFEGLAR